ncbi:MAG TPA: decarboxylating 6-phosphogluconate dehydrogenase [Candidatus Nanoarchaeia archaeon]|nr:decarboxylating 6-phosphogluconate dehydrogenase [Candidatus Nanoarchaeia archaeon]
MKIGFIGLGRMGFNIVLNLKSKKVDVVAHNRSPEPVDEIKKKGVSVAYSVDELMKKLPAQKIVWIMVTAGKPVDAVIEELLPCLKKGDIVVDGGNSFYKDSVRRYEYLRKKGINFIDIGTSGGLKGARYGACLTIGGDEKIFRKIEPVCRAMSQKDGYAYVGKSGAGHFVKMVHNGIEYALLESYGEGYELLLNGPYKNLDFEKISKTWKNGSVIRSWLVELAEDAFKKDPKLSKIEGVIGGGETGRWTIETAKEFGTDVSMIELSLEQRKKSQANPRFAGKVVAALRNEFGGHAVIKKK